MTEATLEINVTDISIDIQITSPQHETIEFSTNSINNKENITSIFFYGGRKSNTQWELISHTTIPNHKYVFRRKLNLY